MGNLVSSEAVYNKKDTEDLFTKKSDIYTKNESDVKFQPKGDYAVVGGVYAKTDVYNKTESDTLFQPKGDYALTSALAGYQPKGDYALTTALADYALKTDYQTKGNYAVVGDVYNKTESYNLFQTKGNYALTSALDGYQPKGDYALTTALADYALKTALDSYQPKGNYAVVTDVYTKADVYNKTESNTIFQTKGNYALTTALADYQPKVVGGVYNKTESDARFQPTVVGGVYNKTESDARFQQTVVGGVYAKPDVYNKTESDARFQPTVVGGVYNKTESDARFQQTVVGGVYLKTDLYNRTESDTRFQPKGDYALTNALAAYAKKTDILKGDTGPQGPKGDKGGVQIDDTRSANSPPSFYRAKGVNKYFELKTKTVIGTPSTQEYNMVETIVSWGDVSGGPVVQIAYGENKYYRQSSSESAWGPWKVVLQSEANGNTTIPGVVNARGVTTTDITATGNVQIANGYISNDLWFNGPTNRWILHTPDDGRTEMYITPGNDAKNDWNWPNSTIFFKDGSITTKKLTATDLNATNFTSTNVNATNVNATNVKSTDFTSTNVNATNVNATNVKATNFTASDNTNSKNVVASNAIYTNVICNKDNTNCINFDDIRNVITQNNALRTEVNSLKAGIIPSHTLTIGNGDNRWQIEADWWESNRNNKALIFRKIFNDGNQNDPMILTSGGIVKAQDNFYSQKWNKYM